MSTGPRARASFIQGNQSPVGQDASQSVLHYLFQEVSKLSPPIPKRFLETNSKSTWIKSKEDAHSCSDNPRLSHMSLNSQSKNMQENSFKVLSLINLQCERLLHEREDGELDQSSLLSLSAFGHPSPSSSLNALKAGHTVKSDLPNSEGTLRSSSNEVEIVTAAVSQLQRGREDYSPDVSGCKPEPLVKTSSEGCSIKTQITESTGTVNPEQSEDDKEAPQTSEVKFDVELDWSSDWSKDCLATQHTFYDFLPEADNTKEPCNDQQQIACVAEPILTLDHNANVCLNTNSLCDNKPLNSPLSMESVDPQCKTSKPSHSLQQPDAQVTGSTAECGPSSEEISQQKSMGFNVENGNTFSAESSHEQKETSVQCTDQCPTVRAKRRKQSCPSRSANAQDPDFRGVMFRMDTELDDTKEHCRLVITSKYSKGLSKGVKKPRLKAKLSQKSLKTSSDEESDTATSGIKGKLCASCGTKKTPMWRDADDGTPLCNACGIRYKKYRVRCVNCWHIPKKEGNSNSCCVRCGNFVRQASAHRKPIMLK